MRANFSDLNAGDGIRVRLQLNDGADNDIHLRKSLDLIHQFVGQVRPPC